MRFRSHLLASAAVGLVLYPRKPAHLAALVLAGTLIDVDHVVLYAFQTGDWSLVGAIRYDRYRHRRAPAGDTRPRYGPLRSWAHEPLLILPPLWAVAATYPWLRPIAAGLSLHLLLDHYDLPWRAVARLRARGRCEGCGRSGLRLWVHRYGRCGSYTYRVLCRTCSDRVAMGGPLAHAVAGGSPSGAVVH